MTPADLRARIESMRRAHIEEDGEAVSGIERAMWRDVLDHIAHGCPEDIASELAQIAVCARQIATSDPLTVCGC